MPTEKTVVNRPTGRLFRVTKGTKRGSDRFGDCELCGKHMSECFMSTLKVERKRESDGTLYLSGSQSSVFAHESCIADLAKTDPVN